MAKIIVKKAKDNSKNRYRERRRVARELSSDADSLARKIEIELYGGAAGLKAERAIFGMVEAEKSPPVDVTGGDAFYLKVNHAHRRDPKKKWS